MAMSGRMADGIELIEGMIPQNDAAGERTDARWGRIILAEKYIDVLSGKKKPPLSVILRNIKPVLRIVAVGASRARKLLLEATDADSDEVAQALRFDGAQDSEMISPVDRRGVPVPIGVTSGQSAWILRGHGEAPVRNFFAASTPNARRICARASSPSTTRRRGLPQNGAVWVAEPPGTSHRSP